MSIAHTLLLVCMSAVIATGCQSSVNPTLQLAPANSPADPTYSALNTAPGTNKAQAVATALTQVTGAPLHYSNHVVDMPNPVVAAIRALTECENARANRSIPTSACELRRRNNQLIHSTEELTRGLQPDRNAFIWRIQRRNSNTRSATLYLAGSIHVLKPTMQAPPSYTEAFNLASTLVLEVDQSNLSPEQSQLLIERYGTLPAGIQQIDLFTLKELAQVERYITGLGVPASMVANMKPAMLLLQAGVLEYIAMGYLAQHGVDTVFEAQKGDRRLVGLETIDEQLAAATALPLNLQAELLLETLAEAEHASEDISALVHAWLSGDAQALNREFSTDTDSPATRAWLDDLLVKRNVVMADGLIQLLSSAEQQDTIFALVGAAHLVGSGSVIELLETQGFQAQRLQHSSLQSAR